MTFIVLAANNAINSASGDLKEGEYVAYWGTTAGQLQPLVNLGLVNVGMLLLSVYLVVIWSRQHNK